MFIPNSYSSVVIYSNAYLLYPIILIDALDLIITNDFNTVFICILHQINVTFVM